MATEFRLPELGENIEAGDVVRVAVTAGETINEGQTVVELETDKAVIEVPSTVSGVIEKVIVTPGQRVKAGDVLFTYSAKTSAKEPAGNEPGTKQPTPTASGKEPETKEAPAKASALKERSNGDVSVAAPETRAAAANASLAEFRLPELGENIESGDVVRITVQPGEEVTAGQTVLELETDKAVVEVPSTVSGTVRK